MSNTAASASPHYTPAQVRELFYTNARSMNPSPDLMRAIEQAEAAEAREKPRKGKSERSR